MQHAAVELPCKIRMKKHTVTFSEFGMYRPIFPFLRARSRGNGARGVRTRRLHSVPSWREYQLEPKGIQLEGDDPVEVQSCQDYYREKWRS